jgi:hypothetical protein
MDSTDGGSATHKKLELMKSNVIESLQGKQMAEGREEEFEHLQARARTGILDFIPQERNRLATSAVSSIKLIEERVGATAQTSQIFCGQRCDPYYHSGLNE